jgi:hypothetical protein
MFRCDLGFARCGVVLLVLRSMISDLETVGVNTLLVMQVCMRNLDAGSLKAFLRSRVVRFWKDPSGVSQFAPRLASWTPLWEGERH